MAPIRSTSRVLPNNVTPSLELTSIHNSLQITQLAISQMQSNCRLTFTAANINELTTIQTAVHSIQHKVVQLTHSIGKNKSATTNPLMHVDLAAFSESQSSDTSRVRILTPQRALINTLYNRSPKKTAAQAKTMDWVSMSEMEENQLLKEDRTEDMLTQAMKKAELQTELESVSD